MGAKASPVVGNPPVSADFIGSAMKRAIAVGTGTAVPRGASSAPIATPATAAANAGAAAAAATKARKRAGASTVLTRGY